MSLQIFHTAAALTEAAARHISEQASAAISARGRFSLVLSGGSTPRPVYERLVQAPYRDALDWSRIHIFFGDERCVAPDHADSNYRMASQALLQHVPIPESNIARIRGEIAPEDAADAYEARLRSYFAGQNNAFDLILLGLGDDAHTASLFPHTAGIHEKHKWVKAVYVEKLGADRITLTPPILNTAQTLSFLVTGAGKAQAVYDIMHGAYAPDSTPAQIIRPESGNLNWFLDEAAAARIS